MPRVPKITSLQCLCQISRNKGGMNLIFLHAEKHQFFYKSRLSILVGMAIYVQSTQNNKFSKSLQYLKKEVRNKVDFLCR